MVVSLLLSVCLCVLVSIQSIFELHFNEDDGHLWAPKLK